MWPPPRSKRSFAIKDWITVAISTLALSISAITAYVSVLRQTERLSVVAQNVPRSQREDREQMSIGIDGFFDVSLINSGDRTIAVLSVELIVLQIDESKNESCGEFAFKGPDPMKTSFTPIMLKGNEVATERIKITFVPYVQEGPFKNSDKRQAFPVREFNYEKQEFPVDACLRVRFVTPSAGLREETVSVVKYSISYKGSMYGGGGRPGPVNMPQVLIDKASTIFETLFSHSKL
jgi:hypothetical protein